MHDHCRHLWSIVSQWSDSQIDLLLEALKRDRSLEVQELSRYVGTKTPLEVRDLISSLLGCTEEEIIGINARKTYPSKPEGAVDILTQVLKHVSPDEFACSKATGEALEQCASWLEAQEEYTSQDVISNEKDFDLTYSELFKFLAALSLGRPLPSLSGLAAGAVLDLVTCLAHVVKLLNDEPTTVDKPDVDTVSCELRSRLQTAYRHATDRVVQLVGVYLASAAAVQLNCLQSPRSSPFSKVVLEDHPVAPYFVLDGVEHPKSMKAMRMLRTNLFRKFSDLWNLPKIAEVSDEVQIECSPKHPDFRDLTRQMNMFTLNPFALPMSVISPFQTLVNEICQPRLSSSIDLFKQFANFSPSLISQLSFDHPPHIALPMIPCTSTSRSPKRSARSVSEPDKVPCAKRRKRVCARATSTKKLPVSRKQTSAGVTPTPTHTLPRTALSTKPNTWKRSDFFKSVTSDREALVAKKAMEKYIVVLDNIHKPKC